MSDSGDTATLLGYINNLHPTHHRALYAPIASIVARFVSLFERVLAEALTPPRQSPIKEDPYGWYESIEVPEPDEDEVGPDEDYDALWDEWNDKYKWPRIPEPQPFAHLHLQNLATSWTEWVRRYVKASTENIICPKYLQIGAARETAERRPREISGHTTDNDHSRQTLFCQ